MQYISMDYADDDDIREIYDTINSLLEVLAHKGIVPEGTEHYDIHSVANDIMIERMKSRENKSEQDKK